MANTWYVDYVNGADTNNGNSWGTAFKKLDGATTAKGVAAGDTIKVAKSPDPTLVGTGTWTGVTRNTVALYVSITSSTNASPIVVTTSSTHGFSNGDVVLIVGHMTNTNANGMWKIANVNAGAKTFELVGSTGNGVGSSGQVWKRTEAVVELSEAVTADIDNCEVLWSQGTNVNTYLETYQIKEQCGSCKVATGAVSGAQKVAYHALSSTANLSGYNQVSFWIQLYSSAITAGLLRIVLCSDATGDNALDTLNIPAISSLYTWVAVTIDKGSALSNGVNSIAIYTTGAYASKTFYVDNFIACKNPTDAKSLSLNSLISKNSAATGGNEGWFCVESITKNTFVTIQGSSSMSTSTTPRGYVGSNGAVDTYKREPIKTVMANSGNDNVQAPAFNGTLGNTLKFEGGYDTVSGLQDGETFYDGQNFSGRGVVLYYRQYTSFNRLNFSRYYIGITLDGSCLGNNITCQNITACGAYGLNIPGSGTYSNNISITNCTNNGQYNVNLSCVSLSTITVTNIYGSMSYGMYLSNCGNNIINGTKWWNCGYASLYLYCSSNNTISNMDMQYNNTGYYPLYLFGTWDNKFRNITVSNNSYLIRVLSCRDYFYNCLLSQTGATALYQSDISRSIVRLYSTKHNQVDNSYAVLVEGGNIVSNVTDPYRHTASGLSWKLSPTSTTRDITWPLFLKIAEVAFDATASVTVSAWMYRTNTALTMSLVCRGLQIEGVDTDVVSSITGNAGTWQQVTINFQPIHAGVVEIEAWVYGGTTYDGYVDDVTVSMA